MTHLMSKLSRSSAAAHAQISSRHSFAAAAPTAVAATRASTALAMSMMVALRYLDGHRGRAAVPNTDAIPDSALS